MTGFGSASGQSGDQKWSIEIRSVNARGLDVRMRSPEGLASLERTLRARVSEGVRRGTVNVGIRVGREEGSSAITADPDAIRAALASISAIEDAASEVGIDMRPSSAAELLSIRGVLEGGRDGAIDDFTQAELVKGFEEAFTEFLSMRREEGDALATILRGQIADVAKLTDAAESAAGDRIDRIRSGISTALETITGSATSVDEGRIEAELSMIAVKSDVTEEIDRLRTHATAAVALLDAGGAIGRKFDFLTQEFNREANTLCSKAQSAELTAIGLDLKAVIDQMREQVQNLE